MCEYDMALLFLEFYNHALGYFELFIAVLSAVCCIARWVCHRRKSDANYGHCNYRPLHYDYFRMLVARRWRLLGRDRYRAGNRKNTNASRLQTPLDV